MFDVALQIAMAIYSVQEHLHRLSVGEKYQTPDLKTALWHGKFRIKVLVIREE